MTEGDWLAERFEENRGHLRAVAYRMLGSLNDADDAVQESWLRLSRNGAEGVDNLGGWLTTVVARVCLDMLRSRNSRKEEPLERPAAPEPRAPRRQGIDPEVEAQMADAVGLALLVVLDRLAPAERLAFVLHDLFDLPFEEIAGIVGRSPVAARQLASRARRRVQGVKASPGANLQGQRKTVEAFLAALRGGDLQGLMAVLDPDVVIRVDEASAQPGMPLELRGAEEWAPHAMKAGKGARLARVALVDGTVGIVVAPRGRLFRVLRFAFAEGRIAGMEVIGDPQRLQATEVAVLE
ncbi:MAG: sigma-70 family RNA polymerase sigma factor [Acidobacteriaceae bacterium]